MFLQSFLNYSFRLAKCAVLTIPETVLRLEGKKKRNLSANVDVLCTTANSKSFHVVDGTRTAEKFAKVNNSRANRVKELFFCH